MTKEMNLEEVKKLLDKAEAGIREAKSVLFGTNLASKAKNLAVAEGQIVEGVFDGVAMLTEKGKSYQIPANYASKSKLVSGDILKLTILDDGTFLYKQIGPVKRVKLIGNLIEVEVGKYVVKVGETEYRVLPASVTYFKAETGDKLTILVPEDEVSEWAAVENLLGTEETNINE